MSTTSASSHRLTSPASSSPVPPEVRTDLAASLVIALLEQSRSQQLEINWLQLEINWLQLEINWLREQLEFACFMLRPVGTMLQ